MNFHTSCPFHSIRFCFTLVITGFVIAHLREVLSPRKESGKTCKLRFMYVYVSHSNNITCDETFHVTWCNFYIDWV